MGITGHSNAGMAGEQSRLVKFPLVKYIVIKSFMWGHCTLQTAQCKLHTAPANANVPASDPVQFILHNTMQCIVTCQEQHLTKFIYTKDNCKADIAFCVLHH